MATPDRLPYERRLEDFMRIVRGAQRTIAAQVRAAIEEGRLNEAARRRAQLSAVLSVLEQLGADIEPLARQLVAEAVGQSADATAREIDALTITAPEIPGAFSSVSREAVATLQDAITGRLVDARRTIGRTVEDVYATAGRRAALRAVLGADGSPRAARRQLIVDLKRDRDVQRMLRDGGFGFVDRAGKRWSLEAYAEMAIRTTTREAVVQGALARMAAHGITIARVSVSAKPCPVCAQWQGRLVSLDGQDTSHMGEAVTALGSLPNGGPPFHPNCRHTLMPVSTLADEVRAGYSPQGHGFGGVLPTQRGRPQRGAGQARPPGFPEVQDLVGLNAAIHEDAGQPERISLDEKRALQSALDRASRTYSPTIEGIIRTAAELARGIASTQAFRDGNRRTAYFATLEFLTENGLGYLMSENDHMMVRHLNRLVEDQGRGRVSRVTVQTFVDLFTRRLRSRKAP